MVTLAAPGNAGQIFKPATCEVWAVNDLQTSIGLIQVVGTCTVQGSNHAMLWNIEVKRVQLDQPIEIEENSFNRTSSR
jgi:hypothetical protein